MRQIALSTVVSLLIVSQAMAGEAADPVNDFTGSIRYDFDVCKVRVGLALLEFATGEEAAKKLGATNYELVHYQRKAMNYCQEIVDDTRPLYTTAMQQLSDEPLAVEAGKDLYSYFLASIKTVWLRVGELKISYDHRMAQRAQGIADRIARLHLEAEE